MKKAETLKDVFNIFNPQKYLQQDTKEFYVDVYKDFTDDLSIRLELSEGEETIFVAGQSGNGKSSALQLFSTNYPKLSDYYDIKVLNARDIFDTNNIDVADILLMMGYIIVENNENLKQDFFDILETMRKLKLEELEYTKQKSNTEDKIEEGNLKSKFNINLGFLSAGMNFKDTFKMDNQHKKIIRELVKVKKKDFIDKINEIILRYKRDILKEKKRLLLIIDDIEKIKDSDNIFTEEINTLLQIKCSKIITMPIHLKRMSTFAGYDAKEISFKLKTKNNEEIEENINKLENIINIRLENQDLIDAEAKKLITRKSGGNLRQLVKIVKESAVKAIMNKSQSISLYDVESAILSIKRDYSAASIEIKEFLEYIKEYKNPKDFSDDSMKKLKIATKESLIFAYYNGELWFDLNPIILDDLN